MAAIGSHGAIFCLLLLVGSVGAARVNPIDQVISLMDDLTAKVTKDGEVEEKAFKEFFEWCDDAATNAKHTLTTANSDKEKLQAVIDKGSADVSAAATSIEQLAASIATAEADLAAATEIRNKEAGDFATTEGELVDGVDTLDRAISTLSSEMAKNPALLQQTVDSKNIQALLATLDVVVSSAAISSADKSKLAALVQSRQSAEDDDAELGAPAAANYKSHSTGIVDILEDMKEKAEAELADARKAESNAKHNFSMLKQSLDDQLAADNKDLSKTKTQKAEAEESKATAEGDLAMTEKDIKNTQASLDTVSTDCMTSASDHEASTKARAEELSVIAQAKKIVQDAVGGAVSQSYSFVQVRSQVQTRADLANLELVAMVKKLAKDQHSAALAQLASRVSAVIRYGAANGDDVFGKVKGLITDMIEKLQKDAANEADHKAYCDEEMAKTKSKKEELASDIDSLSAKIDKAAAGSAKNKEEVATLQRDLADLAKTQAEMDKARADENAAFNQAKSDLSAGITGVQKALEVLREYYGSASLIQDGNQFDAFMQQPAPPAGHSKAGGAGASIINVLEVCESDFSKDLAQEEMAEADAASTYERVSQENKITKATKDQDVKYKTKEAKSLDKAIAEHSSDRSGLQTEQAAVLEYQEKLNGMCIAQPESYEERKARREAEITGLKEALNILEGEGVFLQKPRHLRAASAH